MAGGVVSSSIQDSRRRVLVRRRQKNPAKERSSTELRFASFLFRLCGRGETCQGSPMNALRAPLTALAARREECCYFLLDNADVVIDGMLRQLTCECAANSPAFIDLPYRQASNCLRYIILAE